MSQMKTELPELERSDDWIIKASSTIGGSSAATACGEGRFARPIKLWERMTAARKGQVPERIPLNDDMRRGILHEPIGRQLLSERLGVPIHEHAQDQFVRNEEYPWAHCLPDGFINAKRIVEIKCPRSGMVAKCNAEGLPNYWRIQALHNLAVYGADVCEFGIYDSTLAYVSPFTVERDDVFIERLMEREQLFWGSVLAEIEPEPDEEPVWKEPEVSDAFLKLDSDEARRAAVNFLRLRDLMADAEMMKDAAKVQLVEVAGDEAAYFEIVGVHYESEVSGRSYPNLRCHHRRQKGAKRFDKDRALRQLHAFAAAAGVELDEDEFYTTAKPSRPFRVYPGR